MNLNQRTGHLKNVVWSSSLDLNYFFIHSNFLKNSYASKILSFAIFSLLHPIEIIFPVEKIKHFPCFGEKVKPQNTDVLYLEQVYLL